MTTSELKTLIETNAIHLRGATATIVGNVVCFVREDFVPCYVEACMSNDGTTITERAFGVNKTYSIDEYTAILRGEA